MARIEDIERRLLNWARWKIGQRSGGMGFASANMMAAGGRDGYREPPIPTCDSEAVETATAINTLEPVLQKTLDVHYVLNSPLQVKLNMLGCSERTVQQRIEQAHWKIQRWLSDRVEGGRARGPSY